MIDFKVSQRSLTDEKQNQSNQTLYALSSRALIKSHVIARNSDWFIALFAPDVIGRSKHFGICFSTVIWKPLWYRGKAMTAHSYFGLGWDNFLLALLAHLKGNFEQKVAKYVP